MEEVEISSDEILGIKDPKEFLRLKHAYVSSPDRELAQRVCKSKRYKVVVDDKIEKFLASLPLEKELDAVIAEINKTVLNLCLGMSENPISDKVLTLMDNQRAELKKQADLLNKEVKDRFHKFYDHLRYFKLERSLLKLNTEAVKTLPRKIFKVTIKERAKTRLTQFPLFATALAEKVCQENTNVTIEPKILADLLQQCRPFIAYVVKKNASDYCDDDNPLMENLARDLSNIIYKDIDPLVIVEQSVLNTMVISSARESTSQLVSLLLDDSTASKQAADEILAIEPITDITLLKGSLEKLLQVKDSLSKISFYKNILNYFNLDTDDDSIGNFVSLLHHMVFAKQCGLITTKEDFIERYHFEKLEEGDAEKLFELYQQALQAYLSLQDELAIPISETDILKITDSSDEKTSIQLKDFFVELKSSVLSHEHVGELLLHDVAVDLFKNTKDDAAELFRDYKDESKSCSAQQDLINRFCVRGVRLPAIALNTLVIDGFDFRDCEFDNISFKGAELNNCHFDGSKFRGKVVLDDILCDDVSGTSLSKAISRSCLRSDAISGQINFSQTGANKSILTLQTNIETIHANINGNQRKLAATIVTLESEIKKTKERLKVMLKNQAEEMTEAMKKESDKMKLGLVVLEEKLTVVKSLTDQYLAWRKRQEYFFGHDDPKIKGYFSTLVTKINAIFDAMLLTKSGIISTNESDIVKTKNKMGSLKERGCHTGTTIGAATKETSEFLIKLAITVQNVFANAVTANLKSFFHGFPIVETVFGVISAVTEFATERWADNIMEDSTEHLDGLLPSLLEQLSVEIACAMTESHSEQIKVLQQGCVHEFAESGAFRVLVGLLNCQFHFNSDHGKLNYKKIVDQILAFIARPEIKQGKVAKRVLNLNVGHQTLHAEKYFDVFLAGDGRYFKVIEGLLNNADQQAIQGGMLVVFSKNNEEWVMHAKDKKDTVIVNAVQINILEKIVKETLGSRILDNHQIIAHLVKNFINKDFKKITLDEDMLYRFSGEVLENQKGEDKYYSHDFPGTFDRAKSEHTLARLIGYISLEKPSNHLAFYPAARQKPKNAELMEFFGDIKEVKKVDVRQSGQKPALMKIEKQSQARFFSQDNNEERFVNLEKEVDTLKKKNQVLEKRLITQEQAKDYFCHRFFQIVQKVDDTSGQDHGQQPKVEILCSGIVDFMKEFYGNNGQIPHLH